MHSYRDTLLYDITFGYTRTIESFEENFTFCVIWTIKNNLMQLCFLIEMILNQLRDMSLLVILKLKLLIYFQINIIYYYARCGLIWRNWKYILQYIQLPQQTFYSVMSSLRSCGSCISIMSHLKHHSLWYIIIHIWHWILS